MGSLGRIYWRRIIENTSLVGEVSARLLGGLVDFDMGRSFGLFLLEGDGKNAVL